MEQQCMKYLRAASNHHKYTKHVYMWWSSATAVLSHSLRLALSYYDWLPRFNNNNPHPWISVYLLTNMKWSQHRGHFMVVDTGKGWEQAGSQPCSPAQACILPLLVGSQRFQVMLWPVSSWHSSKTHFTTTTCAMPSLKYYYYLKNMKQLNLMINYSLFKLNLRWEILVFPRKEQYVAGKQ